MKKSLLTLSLLTGLATCVHAQGVLGPDGSFSSTDGQYGSFTLDNDANSAGSDTASSGGLVFIGNSVGSAVPLSDATGAGEQDINIVVYNGSSVNANNIVVSLLLGAGDTGPASGDASNWGTPGVFYEGTGSTFYDTQVAGGGTATFTVQMWTGNNVAYNAAAFAATFTFNQALGDAFGTPAGSAPNDFTSMPGVALIPTPEPATLAFAGLGGLSVLLFRRRK